jgi:hypothetical protein
MLDGQASSLLLPVVHGACARMCMYVKSRDYQQLQATVSTTGNGSGLCLSLCRCLSLTVLDCMVDGYMPPSTLLLPPLFLPPSSTHSTQDPHAVCGVNAHPIASIHLQRFCLCLHVETLYIFLFSILSISSASLHLIRPLTLFYSIYLSSIVPSFPNPPNGPPSAAVHRHAPRRL